MTIQEYNHSSSLALGDFSNIYNVLKQDKPKPADDQKKLDISPSDLGDFTNVWKFLNQDRDIPTLDISTKENHSSDNNDNDSDNDNTLLSTLNNNVRLLLRLRVRDPSLLKASQPQNEIVIEVSEQMKSPKKKSVRFRDETGSSLSDIKEYRPYAKINLPRALTLLPPNYTTPIHVFIDNSNIVHGFGTFLRENKLNLMNVTKQKLNYSALLNILHRNRTPVRKILVASEPLTQSLQVPEKDGYEVSVLKRVPISSSSDSESDRPRKFSAEQGVDELIQLKILESLLDCQHPQVLVLATGDGKAAQFASGGFYATAIRALERGWRVEIVSWATGLSGMYLGNKLRKVAKKGGGAVEVRILDEYWDELVQL